MPNEMMPHQMMRHNHAKVLHEKIAKKAPIDGIWIGDPEDRKTWGIHFKDTATEEQKTEARTEIDLYDPFPTIVEDEAKRASDKVANLIQEKYSVLHQMALSNMRLEAKIKAKKSAEDYLDLCWNWISTALQVYYKKEAEIMAIAADETKDKKVREKDIEDLVDAMDLTAIADADPKVTIKHAMELMA